MSNGTYPLVVVLWEKQVYSGRRRVIIEDEPNLQFQSFDDKPRSISVRKGPGYADCLSNGQEPRVALYSNHSYGGDVIVLPVGDYPAIAGNRSSIKWVYETYPPPVPPPTYEPIPLIVKLYDLKLFGGRYITLIGSVEDLASQFGFNNITSSIKVIEGPDYAGEIVTLYDGKNFSGLQVEIGAGEEWSSLGDEDLAPPNLLNKVSSVKIGT